jgi:hypothetical protein
MKIYKVVDTGHFKKSFTIVGAYHGNLQHAANIDNQRNSTILQVTVAMQQHFQVE